MEDGLIFKQNGEKHNFFEMEDDLNFLTKWKMTSIFFNKLEDDLNMF